MAVKKTSPKPTDSVSLSEAYAEALAQFEAALSLLNKNDYEAARESFEAVAENNPDEAVLCQRSRAYAAICKAKLAPEPAPPETVEDSYHRGVILINDGDADGAIRVLDHALQSDPNSPKLLYARSTAWALKGNAEAAVGDLRQAIAGDAQYRFQAPNEPDFENIREEPSFIDVIEPTPTGA
ncbi:MAG: tetratricopeptide repeat protein [bacterium]|nr:tetratricopeptide repeat protein [bacterium]